MTILYLLVTFCTMQWKGFNIFFFPAPKMFPLAAVLTICVHPFGLLQMYATATDACHLAANLHDFVEFCPCASSEPCSKALLGCGVAEGDVCGNDRTCPILVCGVLHRRSQSQLGQQPAQTSDKIDRPPVQKWQD